MLPAVWHAAVYDAAYLNRDILSRSGSHGLYSRGTEGEGWKYEYMIISRN
jgi:hypothetical protein